MHPAPASARSLLRLCTLAGLATIGLACGADPSGAESSAPREPRVSAEAALGYTLFAPLHEETTYLIDAEGEVVHRWRSEFTAGNAAYLLEDGNLLRCGKHPGNPVFRGGGQGGRLQLIAPDGELIWDFAFSSEEYLHHHDVEPLPGGNLLVIAWERVSREQALAAGRDPALQTRQQLWPDFLVELRPVPPDSAEVVWEWHAWDHLIQDRDPSLPNYGAVAEHPERIDVNADGARPALSEEEERAELEHLIALGYAGEEELGEDELPSSEPDPEPGAPNTGRIDWLHTNAVDYNPELDQIALSVREFSEVWIIDHSTTTAEAAGHTGGRHGAGGDLLYRWGNPQIYGRGGPEDQRLFGQHDVRWIEADRWGAGALMVFNNGLDRPGPKYSSADVFRPPLTAAGDYALEGDRAFGPREFEWTWKAPEPESFYASHISGAQRLANDNTLLCDGESGRFIEVNAAGELVWEYASPFGRKEGGAPPRDWDRGTRPPPGPPPGGGRPRDRGGRPGPPPGGPLGDRGPQSGTAVFRATRIAADHPGLAALL